MTTLTKGDTSGAAEPQTEGSLKRHIGVVGLLFASVGSIIGSGWLFGALNASVIAGPAAIFSWVIGAIAIILIGLVYAELGTMFPISGGVVRFPHLSFGGFSSFTMGWVNWIAAAAVAPIEVEGALQYATKYVGFTRLDTSTQTHPLTGLGYLVAVLAMAFFVVVNYFGIRWFARLNNIAVWWKLGVITLVIVAFLVTTFHSGNFSSHGFSVGGTHAIFTAVATGGIVFSYLGFRQGVELAGETDNPRRNVPIAVVGSVLITAVIYVLLQIAFIATVSPGALDKGWPMLESQLANSAGPLAAISTTIGLGWLATILYIDAVISPADTGLIYTTVTGRISYAMGKNGNAPRALTRTTPKGVPLISLLVTFVIGLIVFLPFPSWQKLVGFITSATVLSFGSGPIVLAAMRRQIPKHERPFRLPGGDVIPFLAFFAANMIVVWAGWDENWRLFLAVLLGFVVLGIFKLTDRSNWMSQMDWRAGLWALPWFAGLALISWLSTFPEDPRTGNTGTIPFGWDFLVVLALSAGVWWLALHDRLPSDRVEEYIEETVSEAAEEEKELGKAP
ncbi:APC family permease [Jatrophihabitans endophyticus]|uniref:APC family permease n=1 Tax=Jatrophihabitans endophyticus TaxID=1206085 RepID=UPI001A02A8CB|nr:APC family permease [Jatrophihabitans endophyticus]MBE7189316.1 APC family permease [Jatrophihabitans endophyticus]